MGDFDHLQGHDPAAEEEVTSGNAEPKPKAVQAEVKSEPPKSSGSVGDKK